MKQRKISKTNVVNFSTYLGMVIFFLVMTALSKAGVLNRSMTGLLVPICCYMSMAVSLNLTVGILGELSLGHAGFMSVGAFAGVIASQSLLDVVPSAGLRLTIAMIVGALFATIAGFIVGAPVLRLQGDYLAIVTLAFGEIIKELVAKIPHDGIGEAPLAKVKPGEGTRAHVLIEQPRGEAFYYVAGNGTKYLERFRLRTPTSQNLGGMVRALQGVDVADVPMIILTIDPCISCTER